VSDSAEKPQPRSQASLSSLPRRKEP
jgi:hypothetical protein